jgi:cell division septum initiation protein DivIVA
MKAAQMAAMEHMTGDVYRVGCDIERELNAANSIIRQQQLLDEENLRLKERIKRLEEELMDAKNKHAALVADVALYEDRGERIKRLEEAGDLMVQHFYTDEPRSEMWEKAKEAKP